MTCSQVFGCITVFQLESMVTRPMTYQLHLVLSTASLQWKCVLLKRGGANSVWDGAPSTASGHLEAFSLESLRHMQGEHTELEMNQVIQNSAMQTAGMFVITQQFTASRQ